MEDHQNLSIGVLREALSHTWVGRVEINEAMIHAQTCELASINLKYAIQGFITDENQRKQEATGLNI